MKQGKPGSEWKLSSNLASKGQFATVEITPNQIGYTEENYPTGFTKTNSFIVGLMNYNTGNRTWYYESGKDMIVLLGNKIGIYASSTSDYAYGKTFKVIIGK